MPDTSLGTTVTPNGRVHTIAGGTIRGTNLFHSFNRFDVGTGDTASFTGPSSIDHILSRVTGGHRSQIDGLLQSQIPGANLYLLNPSGVLFGPNASLDVTGSFHLSTADFLRLADGEKFAARLGAESVLTMASPAAFGFMRETPAGITVQGSALTVSESKAVSVVGGEVQIIGGKLVAPSGRIQIASVASPGEVRFSSLALAPALQVDGFTRLGRLELAQDTRLDASGVVLPESSGAGGTVLIRSGRLRVDQSQILANTLGDVHGASLAVDLGITGDAIMVHDAELRASPQRDARPSGTGNGGILWCVRSGSR